MAKMMSSGFSYLKKAHRKWLGVISKYRKQLIINNQSIVESHIKDKEEHDKEIIII